MKTWILKDEQELVRFKERYEESGFSVNLPYLRQATVRAFFDSNGEMVAGYVINLQRPLRYEMLIPEALHSTIPVLASNLRLCELTANWIYEKTGRLFSERVYLRAFLDALASGGQFVMAGTLVPKIYGIHVQFLSQVLYVGETTYFGKSQTCWVCGAPRSVLVKKLMTAFPLEFAGKFLGRPSYRAKARVIAEAAESAARSSEHGSRHTGGAG